MTQNIKHIAIVTSEFPPQPGGIGNHAYNLAKYLHKAGFSLDIIADQRSENGEEEILFDTSLPFSVNRIKRHNWRFIMYIKRVLLTFKTFKRETIIIATGKFSLWNVAFCTLFFKNKTIAIIHGSEVNFKSFVLRKPVEIALKRMDHIVAVSTYTKTLVKHLGKEVQVIPNGIDTSQWEIQDGSTMILKGSPVLTTVGRVSSRKGQLNVIKQLPFLVKYFPDVHYHCVGIPTEAEDFKTIAKELGVSENITFHGSISDKTLKLMLAKTDIFVMLSSETKTGDVEGFGIAILEANAMGIPAIGSKNCGIEDAIKNRKSGILVSGNDPLEFKEAIEEILTNTEQFKHQARSWAKMHSWQKVINQYLNVIDH